MQCRRNAWAEVAADDSGAEQAYLWLFFLIQVYDCRCVWQRGVGEEARVVEHVYAVNSVRYYLLFNTIET